MSGAGTIPDERSVRSAGGGDDRLVGGLIGGLAEDRQSHKMLWLTAGEPTLPHNL